MIRPNIVKGKGKIDEEEDVRVDYSLKSDYYLIMHVGLLLTLDCMYPDGQDVMQLSSKNMYPG